MILDVTGNTPLPEFYAKKLDTIAKQLVAPFNDIHQQMAEKYGNSLDWWVSELASRNTLGHPTFQYLCHLVLINKMLNEETQITEIKVDSLALFKTLKSNLKLWNKTDITVTFVGTFTNKIKRSIGDYIIWILQWKYFFSDYFRLRKKSQALPYDNKNPVTLVDTFLFDHSFKDGLFQDRYYHYWYLSEKELEQLNIAYLPTYEFDRNNKNIIENARKNKYRFIIKEDYLHISDYIYALLHPIRMLSKKPQTIYINDKADITYLFIELWKKSFSSHSSIEALLRYRLTKRLKEKGLRIRLILDWFENQQIDKAFILGCKKYYEDIPFHSYQVALGQQYYLNFIPQAFEYEEGVLPEKLFISGKTFAKTITKSCPEMNIEIAPSYRYAHVWDERKEKPNSDYFTILVTLPITENDSSVIIDLIKKYVESQQVHENIRIWIKVHPGMNEVIIKQQLKNSAYECIKIIDLPFPIAVEQCNVLLGNTSTTMLEAFVKGIPVVIIGNSRGLTQNPIPEQIPENLYRIAYTQEELADAIQFNKNMTDEERILHQQKCEAYRKEIFEPDSEDGTKRLLNIK